MFERSVAPARERCSFCHRPYDDVGPRCQCIPVVPEPVGDVTPVIGLDGQPKPPTCPACGVNTKILGGGYCPRCSEIR